MTNLTESALEQAIADIASMKVDRSVCLSIKPTRLLVKPSLLTEVGMSIDDLVDMERRLRSELKP